jgi:hypothetical protein
MAATREASTRWFPDDRVQGGPEPRAEEGPVAAVEAGHLAGLLTPLRRTPLPYTSTAKAT